MMQKLKGLLFYVYSVLLGVGTALVGFVIGLLIKNTSETIAIILLLIGLLFITVAVLFARRTKKPRIERIERKLP
jgi:LPXTG-motif cell wall-anchored protein